MEVADKSILLVLIIRTGSFLNANRILFSINPIYAQRSLLGNALLQRAGN